MFEFRQQVNQVEFQGIIMLNFTLGEILVSFEDGRPFDLHLSDTPPALCQDFFPWRSYRAARQQHVTRQPLRRELDRPRRR